MVFTRKIRMARERAKLERIAHERGYENTEKMLYDLHVVEKVPIGYLARHLFMTPIWTLRKRFDEIGIPVRGRGKPEEYSTKIEITKELFHEVCRDGVPPVADRLGVNPTVLHIVLRKWYLEHKKELE